MTIAEQKRHAEKAATSRGHEMAEWLERDGYSLTYCRKCAGAALATSSGPKGSALETRCEGLEAALPAAMLATRKMA